MSFDFYVIRLKSNGRLLAGPYDTCMFVPNAVKYKTREEASRSCQVGQEVVGINVNPEYQFEYEWKKPEKQKTTKPVKKQKFAVGDRVLSKYVDGAVGVVVAFDPQRACFNDAFYHVQFNYANTDWEYGLFWLKEEDIKPVDPDSATKKLEDQVKAYMHANERLVKENESLKKKLAKINDLSSN